MERKIASLHVCPRCKAPIQALVLTRNEIDLSRFGLASRYESWPVGHSAGIAAVQLLARDHLSDWCLAPEEAERGGLKKQRLYTRACPLVAFFSPSPSEQARKLLSVVNTRAATYLTERDLFSLLVKNTSGHLLTIADIWKQFHPMFALDLGRPGATAGLRRVVWKMVGVG